MSLQKAESREPDSIKSNSDKTTRSLDSENVITGWAQCSRSVVSKLFLSSLRKCRPLFWVLTSLNNRLFLCPLKNSLAAPVPPQQREGVCKAWAENTDAESCSTRSLPTLPQQSGQQALGSVCGGVREGTALPVRYKNTTLYTPIVFRRPAPCLGSHLGESL